MESPSGILWFLQVFAWYFLRFFRVFAALQQTNFSTQTMQETAVERSAMEMTSVLHSGYANSAENGANSKCAIGTTMELEKTENILIAMARQKASTPKIQEQSGKIP